MKEIISKIKKTLAENGFEDGLVAEGLMELREYIKNNLHQPGYVKMLRLAAEDIENNGTYTFEYLRGESPEANLIYLLDLLSDHNNKYNKEELQEIRNLMEGLEVEYDDFIDDDDEDEDL